MTPFVVSMFVVWALLTPKDAFHQPLSAPDGATQERGAVTPPVVVKEVHPKGDKTARVEFDCVVLEDGTVSIVKILKSSDSRLDDAATAAMKQWLFKPGTRDGRPMKVRVSVEVSFKS